MGQLETHKHGQCTFEENMALQVCRVCCSSRSIVCAPAHARQLHGCMSRPSVAFSYIRCHFGFGAPSGTTSLQARFLGRTAEPDLASEDSRQGAAQSCKRGFSARGMSPRQPPTPAGEAVQQPAPKTPSAPSKVDFEEMMLSDEETTAVKGSPT